MLSFQTQVKAHLEKYKRNRLGIFESGIWRNNRKVYPHILPEQLYALNILETIRAEFWIYHRDNFDLHAGFHHLNSSQAMAINLIYPYIEFGEARRSQLLHALQLPVAPLARCRFEHIEDVAEGTNFDVYALYSSGARIFVEVKYSESSFGVAIPDSRHRDKLATIYLDKLKDKIGSAWLVEDRFFASYQLFRNLCHLDLARDDWFVLILPERNTNLKKQLTVLEKAVLPALRRRIVIVYLEELIATLQKSVPAADPRLNTHLEMFAEKYLIRS